MKKVFSYSIFLLIILTGLSASQEAGAAAMNDYCITPPFVVGGVKPNLLLMIDNSASQYDLAWTDTSNTYCANAPTNSCNPSTTPRCSGAASCLASYSSKTSGGTSGFLRCTSDADCVVCPASCVAPDCTCNLVAGDRCQLSGSKKNYCRNSTMTSGETVTISPISCAWDNQCASSGGSCPSGSTCTWAASDTCNNYCNVTHACYDDTYIDTGTYIGYFVKDAIYSYDGSQFVTPATISGSICAGSPAYVCLSISGAPAVTSFTARGNFLNWLTASKFDIEKQVLTGGKYDTGNHILLAETRGCSGRKFVKVVPGLTGVTFAIRGGTTTGINNITSQATEWGQTYIEVYQGTYNAAACTAAINDWMNVNTVNLGTLQGDSNCCLEGCPGGTCKTNGCNPTNSQLIVNGQIIHDCFWYYNGHGLSNTQPIENACVKDWLNNSPTSITSPDAADAICSSVLSHQPSLLDGNTLGYLGRCYNSNNGTWDEACVLREQKDFCQGMGSASPVPDPASSTNIPGTLQSVPGFVAENGLAALPPVGVLTVKVGLDKSPAGLINKYANSIRFGVMSFNNNGSKTECNTKGWCSITTGHACTSDTDCSGLTPSGQRCVYSIPCASVCLSAPNRQCNRNEDCANLDCTPLTKTDGANITSYIGDSLGDHGTANTIIYKVDQIPAVTWTPFAEALYNAIGYYAKAADNDYTTTPFMSRDLRFQGDSDYLLNKNPSQYKCQKNNILLITDGMSTADESPAVDGTNGIATLYASQVPNVIGGTTTTGLSGYDTSNNCPRYMGSRSVSDLAWVANHLNINTFLTSGTASTPASAKIVNESQRIKTYVVYSGLQMSNEPGLCDPKTLMDNTATNGGTSLLQVTDLRVLWDQLDKTFQTIATGASSGTAASVLASGEGSGANLIQALFYPSRDFTKGVCSRTTPPTATACASDGDCPGTQTCLSPTIKWIGSLQNFWYYVDPRLGNSSIRELPDGTTSLPYKLDLKNDDVLIFNFDGTNTLADLYMDSDGNGVIDGILADGTLPTPPAAIKCLDEAKNGSCCTGQTNCSDKPVGYLWEAGKQLYKRDAVGDPRSIYTTKTGFANSEFKLTAPVSDATLLTLLQASSTDGGNEASEIVKYISGQDVSVCSISHKDCTPPATCAASDGTCQAYRNRTAQLGTLAPSTWKLGDVINSTPKVSSMAPLNLYHKIYGDASYQNFINSSSYQTRGMVFVGANDGMLHALKLGTLNLVNDNTAIKATLDAPPSGSIDDLGKEAWAYIPKNALPYLRYMTDPNYGDGNHLYYVDATPFIFDASIGPPGSPVNPDAARQDCSTPSKCDWRTILIGGMRFGGASGKGICSNNHATSCIYDSECGAGNTCVNPPSVCSNDQSTKCITDSDCGAGNTCLTGSVKPPIKDSSGNPVGYSSYFALDVTDQTTPRLLWEFSAPDLGFSTTGPAIVRINGVSGSPARSNPKTNGHWFAVFASGPTGPIDTISHQFKGQSNQNLKIYVIDLTSTTGSPVTTFDAGSLLGLTNAFAGSLTNAAVDFDQNDSTKEGFYSDDALYFGYTQKDSTAGTWTKGGVLRLATHQSSDPSTWTLSPFMDSDVDSTIGPVTAAVAKLQNYDTNKVFLYFGTGRYFYKIGDQVDDPGADTAPARRLYGVLEPCFVSGSFDPTCTSRVTSTLVNVTSSSGSVRSGTDSWVIDLDLCTDLTTGASKSCTSPPDTLLRAERMVTDPSATPIGAVFFTTTKPTADVCSYGGKTQFWAVQYDTGGALRKGILKGEVLIQVSTGSIEQRDLAKAFIPPSGEGPSGTHIVDQGASPKETVQGRRTDMIAGVPPSGSPPGILIPPKPAKKVIHVKER